MSYYKNRINLEVFHALTDGTGAICFLKELVKRYLLASQREEGLMNLPLEEQEITVEDQITDGFAKYYEKKPKNKEKKKPASYQLEGVKDPYFSGSGPPADEGGICQRADAGTGRAENE